MKEVTFTPKGVCSTQINFNLDDEGRIHDLKFTGGCNGNLKAIGRLLEGRDAAESADILRGNQCGFKGTSCADQLSKAIDEALAKTSKHVYKVPAIDLALEIGNSKCLNIVLLGAVSALFDDIAPEVWEGVLKERVKPKFVELNLNAFHAGRNWMKENM